ncbi:hypothetical protein HanHA300_Chr03g0095531 [Helianthus annuus]|nr:hypothetical protein HanHA300_Chr03g0095531 [Helianthus annuus]KAJ0601161.1 hypothetical protein HanIR_Chr03g0125221 [Helianthus annuus]KAJ0608316.1 hypothetical protein HanHA89_Chr03g0107201 [Helianthus annuus]KAJ0768382.1 hypothetical protein HanLR1_Chr03g0100591 [Helianthus annuus]
MEHFFQENERVECTVIEDLLPISYVHKNGRLEEVEDVDDDNNDEVEFKATHLADEGFNDNDEEVHFNNENSENEDRAKDLVIKGLLPGLLY